jgi:hypothetical protein
MINQKQQMINQKIRIRIRNKDKKANELFYYQIK